MTLRLRLRRVAQLGGGIALLVVVCLSPIVGDAAVGASTSISNLQQKAAEIAQRVATIQTKLQVLAEEYDQAKSHLALLQHDVRSDTAARNAASAAAAADHRNLIAQAVDSYVNNGSTGGISSFLSAKSNSLPAQQTYLEAAAGTLSSAVDAYRISVHQLSVRTAQLSAAESLTNRSLLAIGQSSASANELEDQLTATLSAVRGQVATLVAIAQRKAATAAAARAAAAATVRQASSQSSPAPATPAPVTTTSDTGGAAGEIAVRAAETQLGVPYVWAGSSPGVGFDCSGLAMWAWGHAGVNLPHSAAEQYASIAHVSMSDLQPGDLIFYGYDGYIYHVIMYIGGGRAIQAIDTGTVISITPVWPGAVGAGRP